MNIADAFSPEERVSLKYSEFYALVRESTKAELLTNAVNTDVPHEYMRCMMTGIREAQRKQELEAKK